MGKDTITSTDLKYAEWHYFFISLQKDLDQIKQLNKLLRKDTKLIEEFYSVINTLYNTHVMYSPDIQAKLDNIESKIFSPKYQSDLLGKVPSPQIKAFQFKIIKELEQCLQLLLRNFESNGLMPKRIFTKHKPKGRALLN